MSYADHLRTLFPDLDPQPEDLYLLEPHEIADLPARVPGDALAIVLRADPRLHRVLTLRVPSVAGVLPALLAANPATPGDDVAQAQARVLWEVADWIVYGRAPELYDARSAIAWDPSAVAELVPLQDAVVVDAGAGTGRVTLSVAPLARWVFAVEPVGALRRRLRERVAERGFGNVGVVDGFLHALPLPPASVDVLLTCQSVGWDLQGELAEIERVVRPGGWAVHAFGVTAAAPDDGALFAALVGSGHAYSAYDSAAGPIHRYARRFPG